MRKKKLMLPELVRTMQKRAHGKIPHLHLDVVFDNKETSKYK